MMILLAAAVYTLVLAGGYFTGFSLGRSAGYGEAWDDCEAHMRRARDEAGELAVQRRPVSLS